MSEDKEIREVIQAEKDRGRRRPVDAKRKAELRDIEKNLRRIYKYGDEKELMQFLRGIGLKDESPRFAAVVKVFQSLRRGKPS